jgi:hypothetical protein
MKNDPDDLRVLATISQFELCWSVGVIARLSGMKTESVEKALERLRKAGNLNSGYGVTQDGEERLSGAIAEPDSDNALGLRRWKEEVLEGLTLERSKGSGFVVSRRSEIDTAVLPNIANVPRDVKTPEFAYQRKQAREHAKYEIAKELGIDYETLESYLNEGRVRMCNGGEKRHPGIFDKGGFYRKRNGEKVQRFKPLCRECLREKKSNFRKTRKPIEDRDSKPSNCKSNGADN